MLQSFESQDLTIRCKLIFISLFNHPSQIEKENQNTGNFNQGVKKSLHTS